MNDCQWSMADRRLQMEKPVGARSAPSFLTDRQSAICHLQPT